MRPVWFRCRAGRALSVLIPQLPIFPTGEIVPERVFVRCHAGMLTLPRRHGNIVTPAWQRCYAGMATLLRRHGNVVMPAWQRMMRHVASGTTHYVMAIWVIRSAFLNGKQLNLSSVCSAPCYCQNHLLRMVTATAFFLRLQPFDAKRFWVVWRYKQEMRALKVSVHLLLAWSGVYIYPCVMDG